jgi:Na+-driven multidrug efflux pump
MTLYWWGTFFICMPIVANSALRAGGDAVIPAFVMTVAAVANAIIDPILIFGLYGFPRLELQGAAISNILANACAMSVSLTLMFKRKLVCVSYLKDFRGFADSAKRLLSIALPAGLTNLLPSIYNSVVISILTVSGSAAVAAYGVVNRIEAFAFVILIGLVSGMTPILGQNFGAKKMDRVREAMDKVFGFALFWSLFVGVLLVITAPFLSNIFSDDPDVKAIIILYFAIIACCFPFSYVVSGWASAFNALGKPKISVIMLFSKTIFIMIPAAMIGHSMGGIIGTFWAITVAHIFTGIFIHLWASRAFKAL